MKTDLSSGQHPVNAQPLSHLGLSNFSIHGVVGFEYFLCFLQGAGRLKAPSSPGDAAPPRPSAPLPPPLNPAPHRLSCFQRWKKSWAAISVGWKNLLMVTGSFRVRDWAVPPYLNR